MSTDIGQATSSASKALSDKMSGGSLEEHFSEERPEPKPCERCGDHIEPFEHPLKEGIWVAPLDDVCQDCRMVESEYRQRGKTLNSWVERQYDKHVSLPPKKKAIGQYAYVLPPLQEIVSCPPTALQTDEDPYATGIYLHGIAGSGKTVQGAAAAWHYLQLWTRYERRDGREIVVQPTVRAATLNDIVDTVRSDWIEGGMSQSEALAQWREADLLIIDEIGAERVSEYTSQVITKVADERAGRQSPTIYISNWSLPSIGPAMGSEVADEASGAWDPRAQWRVLEDCKVSDDKVRAYELEGNKRARGNQ